MAEIVLTWDSRAVAGLTGDKVERAVFRAVSKAGGDAIRAMKVEGSRKVRARKRFKVSRVNKALPLIFPRGAKELSALVWRMNVDGRPVPLADFPHTQNRKGVRVTVNIGHTVLLHGAFIATLSSGHEGIFKRMGPARLPIREAFTTRVADVFADNGMVPDVFRRTQTVFSESFSRLLPIELDKLR